ncbi:right-handed parallel beta-helix repeat-containing protein [Verrucomicrobiaceae bacterium N1E253]|uniref:Right-handed parallel beta-helix repeat-containing protein n=1 Tax=Oceaniferula marina TaxID=2748318 RepID=A0A851GDK0_9BACT|nr:right-handed parallel beta-helix repeat-containing protein [Oceaniferula marina]NWK55838.1 right-handed parallel beta-helix repeat-containing protein [Oceaniferula marina]
MMSKSQAAWLCSWLLFCSGFACGEVLKVDNTDELRRQLGRLKPGVTLSLAPGNYGNGFWIKNVKGTKDRPILITGADKQNPPVFSGGKEALHFVNCHFITLQNVHVSGCSANGINADDGGSYDSPSTGMRFENVRIENIGPSGNRDGLKLSGLVQFVVKGCSISGWGGSAVDMVGCRDGIIDQCQFRGKQGYSQQSGIQAKGGSERVTIMRSFFKDAGLRAVNLGGSTGLKFFRPKAKGYEAKEIKVQGNYFVGSMSPVAFVTSIKCEVRMNTMVYPQKWVVRILQEQPTDTFQPCQQGVFEANLVVYDKRVQTFVNVGPNTKPETFDFHKNAWFCSDGDRRPSLPVKETEGVYQVDPMLEQTPTFKSKVKSRDRRLSGIGACAFKKSE